MTSYGDWTEVREYRVWQSDDIYACVTVDKHKNGWYSVSEDGSDCVVKTRSDESAFRYAKTRMEALETEARESCWCLTEDEESQEQCGDAALNIYGEPHGVRSQVYDSVEGTEIESWNL